jgi:hypothetical protein
MMPPTSITSAPAVRNSGVHATPEGFRGDTESVGHRQPALVHDAELRGFAAHQRQSYSIRFRQGNDNHIGSADTAVSFSRVLRNSL